MTRNKNTFPIEIYSVELLLEFIHLQLAPVDANSHVEIYTLHNKLFVFVISGWDFLLYHSIIWCSNDNKCIVLWSLPCLYTIVEGIERRVQLANRNELTCVWRHMIKTVDVLPFKTNCSSLWTKPFTQCQFSFSSICEMSEELRLWMSIHSCYLAKASESLWYNTVANIHR